MNKYFFVETDKSPIGYSVGEEITFKVSVRDNCMENECRLFKWELFGDDGKTSSGTASYLPERTVFIKTSLDRPGFVRLILTALNTDGTLDQSIDVVESGAGADIDKLKYHGNEPDDFDEYWGKIEKMISDFSPELVAKVPFYKDVPEWCDCFDVKISTPVDTFASGYLSIPKNAQKPLRMVVRFKGYSLGGADPVCIKDAICLSLNAHGCENGFSLQAMEEKYDFRRGYGFDNEENKDPYKTYWRNMMIRDLAGVKWAKTLPEWDKKNIESRGGSQAAFQATTVAAHDKDVNFLNIEVPWFCDLNAENHGYMKGWRPEPQTGLEYFDTVIQASRVKCPVKILAYLGDYICPPHSITTLYNTFKTEKQIGFVQSGTHMYRPHERNTWYLQSTDVKPGIYRHYKGNKYKVLYIAKNSETLEETVVYQALYGTHDIWTRPKYMWNQFVYFENKLTRRFEFIENET